MPTRFCVSLWVVLVALVTGAAERVRANEDSPPGGASYLQKHSNDPVQWLELSQQTLETAGRADKLLFVSSGYSACYWCYRMHQDTFNERRVAELLNTEFVPVLVDRELLPSVDLELRTFMESVNGASGWPLNAVLSPNGHPLLAMSYLPAGEFYDRLTKLLSEWDQRKSELDAAARDAARLLSRAGSDVGERKSVDDLISAFADQIQRLADREHGGFTSGAKFPHVPALEALLAFHRFRPEPEIEVFLITTLNHMATSGLRDAVNGGFFRYTSDREWRRPHFEKMLYTQALLGRLYIQAGLQLNKPQWVALGVDTVRFAHRTFQKDDGFYATSLSAFDRSGQVGGDYLWSGDELKQQLSAEEKASLGNHYDPGAKRWLPKPLGGQASAALAKLRSARASSKPVRDTKALAAWNGLTLSALVYSAPFDPELKKAADDLAGRFLDIDVPNHLIGGETGLKADLADLAFLAQGLQQWGSANANEDALRQSEQWLSLALDRFYSAHGWDPSESLSLFGRLATWHLKDDDLPSATSVWIGLAAVAGTPRLRETAAELLDRIYQQQLEEAFFHSGLVTTALSLSTEKEGLHGGKN